MINFVSDEKVFACPEKLREFKQFLIDIGIKKGDSIFLQAASRSLQKFIAPEQVIETIIRLIGSKGTLLVPAFTENVVNEKGISYFDVRHTMPNCGEISRVFFKKYSKFRSVHPTNSVCGYGFKVMAALEEHELGTTPSGVHSPLACLHHMDGKTLLLGVDVNWYMFMHYVEEMARCEYMLASYPVEYDITNYAGFYKSEFYPYDFSGLRLRYDKLIPLLTQEEYCQKEIFGIEAHLIDATASYEKGMSALEKNPIFFANILSDYDRKPRWPLMWK